ncbi:H-2 class II histocompatibility antigen, A-U alpha chain-like [Cololabis saira]|uniref:H-2 class II histocompatibility antigen, A-U alpha chain-like n=1 Tax=Cololabis saira TaxID=129043 RepID=UPI002AD52EBB|nr:H-2 class II histocompatibility antigen, A-U alpha chain-like [Cololabis saira]
MARGSLGTTSWKTAFLLAVTSAKRVSELHALSVSPTCLRWKADSSGVTLWPNVAFLPKVLPPDHANQAIELAAYHPPPFESRVEERANLLCPVRALRLYLQGCGHFLGGNERGTIVGDLCSGILDGWRFDSVSAAAADQLFLLVSNQVLVSSVLHENFRFAGCSDSDGEDTYTLDGEVIWYADFIKKEGVIAVPPFVEPMTLPGGYEGAEAQLQVCRYNLNVTRTAMKDLPPEKDPPNSPVIYTEDDVELEQENTLICFVSGFYPAPVKVFWTKNGEKVTEGTSINIPLPNKDGSFQQISRLNFIPQQGDMYGCSVEHLALTEPLTRTWDVETAVPGVGPEVFCGVGLTIGLLGVAAGTFFLVKGNECS